MIGYYCYRCNVLLIEALNDRPVLYENFKCPKCGLLYSRERFNKVLWWTYARYIGQGWQLMDRSLIERNTPIPVIFTFEGKTVFGGNF